MSFELNAIFSLSIGLGVVVGWIRFHRTGPAYLPFLLLLTAGFLNELLSIILLSQGLTNIINFNAFKLAETLLLLWQFYLWEIFGTNKGRPELLAATFVTAWLTENLLFGSFNEFNSHFIIVHSFFFVMLCINAINKLVLEEFRPLFRQPVFMICMALITYFTYAILIEIFWITKLNAISSCKSLDILLLSFSSKFISSETQNFSSAPGLGPGPCHPLHPHHPGTAAPELHSTPGRGRKDQAAIAERISTSHLPRSERLRHQLFQEQMVAALYHGHSNSENSFSHQIRK